VPLVAVVVFVFFYSFYYNRKCFYIFIGNDQMKFAFHKTVNVRINVAWRLVRLTIVAVEKH